MIRKYGPAIHFSCMRYEAFLNRAKKVAKNTCNFVDIAKSVADTLQSLACGERKIEGAYFLNQIHNGPSRHFPPEEFREIRNDSELDLNLPMKNTNWVEIGGWKYYPNTVVLLENGYKSRSELPKFAKISKIVLQNGKTYAMLIDYETEEFNNHLHEYQVRLQSEELRYFFPFSNFVECEPLWELTSYAAVGQTLISPRHWV